MSMKAQRRGGPGGAGLRSSDSLGICKVRLLDGGVELGDNRPPCCLLAPTGPTAMFSVLPLLRDERK